MVIDMIKGIIFDMDGVMIDTENQSNLGWLWAADRENVEMPLWLIDSFKGAPANLSKSFFDNYYHGSRDYWKMRTMRTEHVHSIRQTEGVPVKPGLQVLLNYIKNRGLKCAVATSTQKSSAEMSLHNIGAWDYLSGVVYGDEVEHGKPEPDIFFRAAGFLGCEPSECIVIEDSINGIKAGHAAGMKVIHVPDTIEISDEVRAMTDIVCHSLSDVPMIVEAWNEDRIVDTVELYEKAKINRVYVDRVHVRNTFAEYTDRYNSKDPKIKLKIDHTYRVADLCERIAISAGMCAYDVELAWLSGMLHDVGRFEQVKRFNTFSDTDSVDHAKFGADLLFKDGLIDSFLKGMIKCSGYRPGSLEDRYDVDGTFAYAKLNKSDMEILELAIRCHNMYRIPEGLNSREKAFCNVLRDADKIDIMRVNNDTPLEDIYNTTTEKLKNSAISEEVMECFYEQRCILKSIRRTPADIVVGHVSLAYELVYDESVRIMKEQGYLEKLMDFSSDNEETNGRLAQIREKMNSYIEERLAGNRAN